MAGGVIEVFAGRVSDSARAVVLKSGDGGAIEIAALAGGLAAWLAPSVGSTLVLCARL